MVLLLLGLLLQTDVVHVREDNTTIDRSCTVVVDAYSIADEDGNGVVHVVGDDLEVTFGTVLLRGARPSVPHDELTGTGVSVRGSNIRISGARVAGYKLGIHAVEADGLVLEDCQLSGNFRQRLGSTIAGEDAADWLWPHANDDHEWLEKYGAAMVVERSRKVTVRRCRVREGQNGLILDRVDEAKIYDNDFSFLSGWGLALWRSSRNVITRNALDFCVRGYSHGVYNRGQDSAGILMFEQCSDNVIAENSATHGGDGLFAFAGQEALGANPPPKKKFDYERRGNNDNLIIRNDFSDAAAHGLELTFSFGNQIIENRLVGNAICGIWGGYSRDSLIAGNQIESNGELAYGLERGGINIEHGQRNWMQDNHFRENECGVHLWNDADPHLADLPWMAANGFDSGSNILVANHFNQDAIAIQLRAAGRTIVKDNEFERCPVEIDLQDSEEPASLAGDQEANWQPPDYPILGKTRPVAARKELRGRHKILITAWGPYDWSGPLLWPTDLAGPTHEYQLLGNPAVEGRPEVRGDVTVTMEGERLPVLTVTPRHPGVTPYRVRLRANDERLEVDGLIVAADWLVRHFEWTTDPREDAATWREEGDGATEIVLPKLVLPFGGNGPEGLAPDRFGTLARTELRLPPGSWELITRSDDGIRVWADGELVIDDWTHHATTEHRATLSSAEERIVELRVEHFELDGGAHLSLEIRAGE